MQARIDNWIIHDSMRGNFSYELYKQMEANKNIYLITADLGYKVFDNHFNDFPDRVVNCGAAEQTMIDCAIGLAYDGRVPFVYSITTFLLYRAFEGIRTYINYEQLNVKLIGSGRDSDYHIDGWSHKSPDDRETMKLFTNIKSYWPDNKHQISPLLTKVIEHKGPDYINLTR